MFVLYYVNDIGLKRNTSEYVIHNPSQILLWNKYIPLPDAQSLQLSHVSLQSVTIAGNLPSSNNLSN